MRAMIYGKLVLRRCLCRRGLGIKPVVSVATGADIGDQLSDILKTTETADRILAIDGCSLNCVKSSLELAGFRDFQHFHLGQIALEKGNSPLTDENVARVVAKATELLAS